MKKNNQKHLLCIENLFNILSFGDRSEIKEAKKSINELWRKDYKIFIKSKKIIFKIIDNFDLINDVHNKSAVISGMDLFFLALADDYFVKLKNFIVKNIQHPDGRVREAARKTGDWLYCSLTSRAEPFIYPEKKLLSTKQKDDQKTACRQYLEFVNELEFLIDKYDDNKEKVKYINGMKPSVNKSLQMIWSRLTDSPVYRRIFKQLTNTALEISVKREEIEKKLEELLKQTESDFSLEDIKKIIYNEKDQNDLVKIIEIFDNGQNVDDLNSVLAIVNDAWNYFPHKCLDGLSPMEKFFKHKQSS